MLFGKGKKKIDEERQLHYGDGKLEKKNSEVIQDIRAYTMAARWFEKRVAEDYRKKPGTAVGCLYFSVFWLLHLLLLLWGLHH
ncbi:hypothetical protein ABC761_23345 [Salmonella sp. ZASA478]|uniref:hypothetical protein n=1 Tax=Salmonella enterica TaxID=28901 RepID=UPI0003D26955|nr:hypothetical protein [Salmonella enterica]ETB97357.1 hypothetical protein CFSAN001681_22270 [Salmonella enterica subsp. enterica serovar Cerro str. CFSAN001681]